MPKEKVAAVKPAKKAEAKPVAKPVPKVSTKPFVAKPRVRTAAKVPTAVVKEAALTPVVKPVEKAKPAPRAKPTTGPVAKPPAQTVKRVAKEVQTAMSTPNVAKLVKAGERPKTSTVVRPSTAAVDKLTKDLHASTSRPAHLDAEAAKSAPHVLKKKPEAPKATGSKKPQNTALIKEMQHRISKTLS